MAFGDTSNPTRFGAGQSDPVDNRALYLDVFGGEVITAFDLAVTTLDKHTVKTVGGGQKSWRFPKTWKSTAEYHTPGQELLGNAYQTGETTVTIDDILVAHHDIADLDEMLSHFDIRGPLAMDMGRALARVFDKNVFRQIALTARTAADGPFPGGSVIDDDTLAPASGVIDGAAWVAHIREANVALFNKDVPEEAPRYCAVDINTFEAIRYATDSNGRYLIQDRDIVPGQEVQGGFVQRARMLRVDDVMVYPTRNMPNTDESADGSVYSKYQADYSETLGLLWTPDAVATVKMLDVTTETARDARRVGDFISARQLVGHGVHRPECAIEFTGTAS